MSDEQQDSFAKALEDDPPEAVLVEYDASACDGAGWYYYDGEYPDEGVVGAFRTSEEARAHAKEAGYVIRGDQCGETNA